MDGGPNRRNKAPFSNFSGLVRTLPKYSLHETSWSAFVKPANTSPSYTYELSFLATKGETTWVDKNACISTLSQGECFDKDKPHYINYYVTVQLLTETTKFDYCISNMLELSTRRHCWICNHVRHLSRTDC